MARFGDISGKVVGAKYRRLVNVNRAAYISKIRVSKEANEGQLLKLTNTADYAEPIDNTNDTFYAVLLNNVKDTTIDQLYKYPNSILVSGVAAIVYAPAEIETYKYTAESTINPGDTMYTAADGYPSAVASGKAIGIALTGATTEQASSGKHPIVIRLT